MTERSYEDAVQTLQQYMNNRWDGREAEGREEMVRILKQSLGYDNNEADSVINAMVRSGQLRYYNARDDVAINGTTADEPAIVAPGQVSGSTGLPGAPTAPGADFSPGYWVIGEDGGDIGGRSGQVVPR